MKKILFIIPSLGVGGAQKVAAFIMDCAVRNKYDVTALIKDKEESNIDINHKIKVLYLNTRIKNEIPRRIHEILAVKKLAQKITPNVIVVFGSLAMPALGAVMSGIPVIGCERGDPHKYSKKRILINKWLYNKYDYCVFQTEQVRQYYRKDQKCSKVIANPCPTVPYIRNGKHEKTIVAAGRLTEDKGFDTLIKAYNLKRKELNDYKVVIYGEGNYRKELECLIDELHLSEKIILYGKVKNLPKYLTEASLFVLTSWYEGIPNVLIEAMSIGLPIVATDCEPGGARLLMNNGKRGGIIVPIRDEHKMAEAIKYMIDNPDYADKMGRLGMDICNVYSPEIIGTEWMNVIEQFDSKDRD